VSTRSPAPRPESAAPVLRATITLPAITLRSALHWANPTRVVAAPVTTDPPPVARHSPALPCPARGDGTTGRRGPATPPSELGVPS
jgi:hypothetical protein